MHAMTSQFFSQFDVGPPKSQGSFKVALFSLEITFKGWFIVTKEASWGPKNKFISLFFAKEVVENSSESDVLHLTEQKM